MSAVYKPEEWQHRLKPTAGPWGEWREGRANMSNKYADHIQFEERRVIDAARAEELSEALHSSTCLLEVMADNAKARGDDVEWAMMSVMAEKGREALNGYEPE